MNDKLAILCAGGPAPGINSVIGAATIRACLSGVEVLGIQEGFKWLMEGDTTHVTPLTISDTSHIHFRGGATLGVSRANPTKDPALLRNTLAALEALGVGRLITIGGDDTAFSAYALTRASREAGRTLHVVHVPKTIDNDLDLPLEVPTFGYSTARSVGVGIVQNLMVDAKTTGRWYLVVAMGRTAGHLALGIGKAAGATLTLVPEEFRAPTLSLVCDTLAGSILKRLAHGRQDGIAVLAEGIAEVLPPSDLAGLAHAERDEHDHVRLAEIDFGEIVRDAVRKRLAGFGLKPTIVAKNIGYELRCADPVPSDMEYTRDLGYCAARYVIEGGTECLIAMVNGHFRPIPFGDIMDPATGRMRVRRVNIASDRYGIARSYMIRLRRADLDDELEMARLAAVTHRTPAEIAREFAAVFESDLDPIAQLRS